MEKFIYKRKDLRCKVKYVKLHQHYELQLQKRVLIFWVKVYKWMTVQDGFWGECERFPILRNYYQFGNKSECYKSGTLDLPKRVNAFFDEYFESLEIEEKNASIMKQVV